MELYCIINSLQTPLLEHYKRQNGTLHDINDLAWNFLDTSTPDTTKYHHTRQTLRYTTKHPEKLDIA